MEGEEIKNQQKTPLLDGWKLSGSGRRNSVTTLRGDFLARLPEKVKFCVNVDVESSSSNIEISNTSSLSKATLLGLFKYIAAFMSDPLEYDKQPWPSFKSPSSRGF